MVTILQVVPRLDAGGSELATLEIAQALHRAGAKALVATEGGRLAADVEKAGGEIVTLPMASKSPLTIIGKCTAAVSSRSKSEASISACAEPRASLERASCLPAHAQALRHHLSRRLWRGRSVQAAYNSVMRRGERIVANSRYTASVIAARAPKAADRIRVIYRGVDRNALRSASVAARRGREAKIGMGRRSWRQDRAACRASHRHQGPARLDRRGGRAAARRRA